MRERGPVIGRDHEIREVAQILRSTGASARTLLVVGAAGTGKTALLERARRAAVEDGTKVLRVSGHDDAATPGAAALADRLHDLVARIDQRRGTRARRQTTGRDGELTVLSALGEALADTARLVPFALLVDDVGRMPAPTASALGLLLRVFRPAGVPVVMAGRPGHPEDGGAGQLAAAADRLLELPPLRPADVETLVVRRFGRPVEPALVTAVLGALGPMAGIPEAVLSVLDALEERGDLLELDGHVCLTEPERALRLTTDVAELGRLCWPAGPPDAVALDAAAAVARHLEHTEIRLADLHRLKPGGPRRAGIVDRTLSPLVEDGILTLDEDGRTSFAVPALGAALRALPTHHTVSSLHALITRSLTDRLGAKTAGAGYPRLADHVAAAGSELDDVLAVDVLLAAARTDARSDWPRSVRAYASALRRLAPHDPRTAGVLRESAELSLRHADHPGALALGGPLLTRLATAPGGQNGGGQDRGALEYVTRVWALAALSEHRTPYDDEAGSRDDLTVRERAPLTAAFAALAGPYGIGVGVEAGRTPEAADGPGTGPLPPPGGTLPAPGAAHGPGSEPPASPTGPQPTTEPPASPTSPTEFQPGTGPLPSPEELRLLVAVAGGRAGLPTGAGGMPALGVLRNAAAHADLAGALATVLGDRCPGARDSTAARYHAMLGDYLNGNWDRALAAARRIEARSRTRGTAAGAAQPARALAAEIHCARGELGYARAWLELIPDGVSHPLVAWARLGLGYWSGRATGSLSRAREDVRRARGHGLLSGVERVLMRCLSFALLEGRSDAMRATMDELEALHAELDSPMTREAVLFGRGLVHGDIDSALAVRRAVAERGDAYLDLLCCLCLVEIGDEPERWLAQASYTARALGIGRATRTTLGHMTRRHSLVLPRVRPAADGLSEEDVKLTAMVSRGATNRQIAARLAWSEKTVERRLTRLFQRTGCRSRVELAAAWLDGSLAHRDLVRDGMHGAAGGSFGPLGSTP